MRKKLNLCNEKVAADTMAKTGESLKNIDLVIGFASRFIVGRIKEGSLESVRIPRFGLFRAKLEMVQYKAIKAASPKSTYRMGGGPLQGIKPEQETQQTDNQ